MPNHWLQDLQRVRGAALLTLIAAISAQTPAMVRAQQEPVAVVAAASVDRILDDVDHLFELGQSPQHAQMIRGVIANFNELRGLDRSRPFGVYLYFPSGGSQEPQPLLFVPVGDVDQMLTSIRIGNALRLEKGAAADRLTLHTEDGEFPVGLQHGYAFVDPTKSGVILNQKLPIPAELLGPGLSDHDAILIVRREGIPPFLFELAVGGIRAEAIKQQQQNDNESDAEYEIRRQLQDAIFGLMESAIRDWQGIRLGLRVEPDDGAQLEANVQLDADGETLAFLKSIQGEDSQFAAQLAELSAFSLSSHWQPTESGREFLATLVSEFRKQVLSEVEEVDPGVRQAITALIDTLEATATESDFQSFFDLVGAPPNGFMLIGAIAVADSSGLAMGIERLLPFAIESADIRDIEMNVGRAGDVVIHRIWPQKWRKQDQRLYGEDAAIYLGAGADALWMAIGEDGTMELLSDTIQLSEAPPVDVLALPRTGPSARPRETHSGQALIDLRVHASEWVGFARVDGGGKNARIAQLARKAFENPDQDGFQFQVHPGDDGLRLTITLEEGYVRLFGLAISESLNSQ